MLAEIITIGDEILIGQIVDTNSAWMGVELNKIGVRVKQITSISDGMEDIIAALEQAMQRADLVFITGGLGPTKDDVTKQSLAKFFGSEMVMNQEALENVERIFKRSQRPVLSVNVKQAEVPHNCIVIQNANGTAPGIYFKRSDKHIFAMPGVPFEMMGMMQDQIIPMLIRELDLPSIQHETILTAGIGEAFLADRISEIEDALPDYIKLAYLPKPGQVRLRLSGMGSSAKKLDQELMAYKKAIIKKAASYVVADRDIPIEQVIIECLIEKGKTLSTAESCTGGYIGHLLTSIPGSSQAYLGGAISYSYDLKENMLGVKHETLEAYGAVSEETVREMALGCRERYQSDYAIACSGIAGPGGGTPLKPVGTVWIALASEEGLIVKKFNFGNKRMQNIERTAINSLYMLFKLINA